MQIIAKKRMDFVEHEITISPVSNEKVAKVIRKHSVSPGMKPVEVPDWIVNDDLFELAVSDRSVIVIGSTPEKQLKPAPEPVAVAQLTTEDKQKLDSILNTPVSELAPAGSQTASYPTTSKGWPATGLS